MQLPRIVPLPLLVLVAFWAPGCSRQADDAGPLKEVLREPPESTEAADGVDAGGRILTDLIDVLLGKQVDQRGQVKRAYLGGNPYWRITK